MADVLLFLALCVALAALAVVFWGIYGMRASSRGQYSNAVMRLRIVLQALALMLFLSAFLFR